MMWILYAFCAALFAGLTSILAKIGMAQTDSNVATALRTGIVVVFAWLVVLVEGSHAAISAVDGKSWLFLVLSGLSTGASWLCYFKALQSGNVNVVVPIDKSSTILAMLLAFVLLGEPLTPLKWVCMALIGIGTYAMIQRQKDAPPSKAATRSILYAGLAALFAAVTSIFGKIGVAGIPANLGTAIRTVVVLFMAWLVVLVTGKLGGVRHIDRRSWRYLALSAIATGLSWLFFFHALQGGPASVVVPIDKLSIVVTVAFAYFVFREKLTAQSFLGLVLLVAGTLLLLAEV